jgi:hypothetical protein
VTNEGDTGYAVEAPSGSMFASRLAVGVRWRLLTNDNLVLGVGYHFGRLINGTESNVSGGPRAWQQSGSAMNGSPSADQLASELIAGLEQHFPETIDLFTRLVADASQNS